MGTLYQTTKKRFVRELQRRATPAERKLRNLLAQHRVKYKFQRPFTIRHLQKIPRFKKQSRFKENFKLYIADFYLPEYATIIELNGEIHHGTDQNIKDNARTLEILQHTKLVDIILRFHNNEVLKNGREVIQTILNLKYVRLVQGVKQVKKDNKKHNRKIAELNEVRSIVWGDPDLIYTQRKTLIKQINNEITKNDQ